MGARSDRNADLVFQRISAGLGGEGSFPDLFRAPVPGGWIVKLGPKGGALCFLADKKHDWNPRAYAEKLGWNERVSLAAKAGAIASAAKNAGEGELVDELLTARGGPTNAITKAIGKAEALLRQEVVA